MMSHDLFNKKLIMEVKKHEFIYNLAHPDRRKGTTSPEKWSEIASVLGDTVKKCKYRWNSLRRRYKSEYLKIMSNNDGAEYESDWKYMDEMAFMQGYVLQDESFLESLSKLSRRDIFCRACLRPIDNSSELSFDSYNIFGTENFAKKLMQCTNLDVVPWDDYPHSVCRKCYDKVWDYCRFQDMCRDSLEKFNVMLENKIELKCTSFEEEISDSFLDSVIDYTLAEIPLKQEVLCENNTVSEKQDARLDENSEFRKHTECENGIKTDVDPLAERADTEFTLEEHDVDNLLQYNPKQKTKRFRKTKTVCKQANTTYQNEEPTIGKEQIEITVDGAELNDPENKEEFKSVDEWNTTYQNEEPTTDKEQIEITEDGAELDDPANKEELKRVDEWNPDSNDKVLSYDENSVADYSDSSSDIPDDKKKSHSKCRFKCDICGQLFIYPHRFEAHQRRHKGLSGYPCTFENCSRAYNRLSDLRNHLNKHNGIPNVYKCDIDNCNMVYSSYSLLNTHNRRVHKKGKELKIYTCEICGKGLTSLRSLKGHLFIHLDKSEWPYGCDERDCNVRFKFLSQKKTHLKRHAGIKNYVCPHCGMRKTTSTELKIHINFHTFERKYPCRICSKVFKSVGTMGTHIRMVHEGKGKKAVAATNGILFPCSFCDRKLSSAHNKKYHEMSHTGEQKPCPCNDCGKTFTTPSHLKQHQLMHVKGEKPYACVDCGLRYKWPSHLKTHMKIHLDGVNPYPCEICGKRFKWPGNLKSHMLLHNEGSTPYTCEECGKGFRWPGSFYNHKKAHMKQKNENSQKGLDQTEHLDP